MTKKQSKTKTRSGGVLSLSLAQAEVTQELFCRSAMPSSLVTTMAPVFTQLERITGRGMLQLSRDLAREAAAAAPGAAAPGAPGAPG